MKTFVYLPASAMNEATQYYTDLIIKSFGSYQIVISQNPIVDNDIDIIVTIRVGDQRQLKYKDKNKEYFYINWYQGIGPEEYELLYDYTLRAKLGKVYLTYFEKKSLKKTDLSLFVSEEMKFFYEKKYNLDLKDKALIIPCYNKHLDLKSFEVQKKYENFSFVYAGALYGWQCIDESLQVFKKVYEFDQSATLTLLTGQKEEAEALIEKYNLKNVSIGFVKLEELQDELKKYKYGFLLRKDDPINNVATPTKMNSYLAAGIIPIYTDVVNSFEENINLGDYSIKCNLEKNSLQEISNSIIEFNKKRIEIGKLKEVYSNNFDNYYNDDKYINMIKDKLSQVKNKV